MNKRTQLIYGNCQVLSPDGELMFRCLRKRADWYLKRNLAEVIEEDPLTIKLNFEPKGKGENHDLLLIPRKNLCVVCGTEDLNVLTRHHIVPYEYRKYFPEKEKSNNSAFIVPICRKCHDEYEEIANKHKKKIAIRFDAPLNGDKRNIKIKATAALNTILNYGEKLPAERMSIMRQRVIDFIEKSDQEINNIDINDDESLAGLFEYLKAEKENEEFRHGKMVVKQLDSYGEFSKEWVDHFFETMKPSHASEELKDFFSIVD
tara:strand:- start:5020 stop:5802 length:783 start_codon:yes stop_codon:yes gene_type:complete